VNVAWIAGKGVGAKTYIAKDLFIDFKIGPIAKKSATTLSWGAAAVTAAAALYL